MVNSDAKFNVTLVNDLLTRIDGEGVDHALKSLVTVLGIIAVTYNIPRENLLQNVGKVYDAQIAG